MSTAKRAISVALVLGACLVGCATVPTTPSEESAKGPETTPSPANGPDAASKAESAPEKDGSPRSPSGGKPEEKLTVGRVAGRAALAIVGVGLIEGMFYGSSYLLARGPRSGWVFIALSPIAAGSGSGDNVAGNLGFVSGVVGLSLYNVIELRKSQYTYKQRFQHNMVGFHVAAALGVGAQALWGPKTPSKGSRLAVGMGVGDEGPALFVGGWF